MPPKGKPTSPIWDLFKIVIPKGDGKKHPDVSCPHCNKLFRSAQVGKHLKRHVLSCCFPADIKLRYAPSSPPSTPTRTKKRRSLGTPRSPSIARETPPKTQRLHGQAELELDLAMAFYTTEISFRVLEDPKMKLLFKHLRPDFKIPSRYKLAGPFLDVTYEREKKNVIDAIKNEPYVTVVTDGWANPNKQSIVNFVITSPRMSPVFWSSVATGDNQHTGEYIAGRIEEVIAEIDEIMRPGAVCGVVTDNAKNMKKAWEVLKDNRPNLTCNGCGAHMMNLITKDVLALEPVKDVLDSATWLSKFILSRYILLDHFEKIQKGLSFESRRRLCLLVPTRWYTSEACMKSVQRNKHVIQAVLEDSVLDSIYKQKKARAKLIKARTLVGDANFWAKIDAALLLLHPINASLAEFERDGSFVSAVFKQFRQLSRNKVYHEELENSVHQLRFLQGEIRNFITSREKDFITPSMKIGYLFDQRLDTNCFSDDDLDDAVSDAAAMITADPEEKQKVSAEITQFVTDKLAWSEEKKRRFQS